METPSSFLFVTFEGGGNVPPVLGVARRLAERGHHVRVLTEPCLKASVEEVGAAFVPFTEHYTRTSRTDDRLLRDWEAKTPPGAIKRTLETLIVGPAGVAARETAAALDAEPADVLVADWLLPGAAIAGEARGVPTAVLVHSIDMRPGPGRPGPGCLSARGPIGRFRDRALSALMHRTADGWLGQLNAVRAEHGLAALDHVFSQYDRADRVLVQTAGAFDFPAEPPPANVRYVGPVLDPPDWAGEQPWSAPGRSDEARPLVVVSLSSTFQNQAALIQHAIDALGSLEVRGLVTLGPSLKTASFRVPANVTVVASAPHDGVFPHAAAVITHGGHGTTMRALAHGLPLIVLPMGRDQPDVAARVVAHGLGLKPRPKPGPIAAAVQRVLEEPAFRAAASRMAQTIRADAARNAAVVELEALVPEQPVLA